MAKKERPGYKVDKEKKIVYIYQDTTLKPVEQQIVDTFVRSGFDLKPKKRTTVDDMRRVLSADKEALAKFNELYDIKGTTKDSNLIGFHQAVQFYNSWKKEHKAKKAKKTEA